MTNTIHLYTMTYWRGGDDRYYCNDVKNLLGRSAKWYTPMRILEMSIDEYIELLLSYNAVGLKYNKEHDVLLFHFLKEKDVKAFCSKINKVAKAKKYYCK